MSICANFRKEAGRIWNQMHDAQKLGISLSEETITETSLYNIARKHRSKDVLIVPATKPQEAKHGADWEWWFTRNGKGIGFRVQAKRLFPSGRYESLLKKKMPFQQLDKLVLKAHADDLNPLYCFYNFDMPKGGFSGHSNNCVHDYRGPSFWGCALALPEDVRATGKDSINDLRSILEPWHTLVCMTPGKNLLQSVALNIEHLSRRRTINGIRREKAELRTQPREVPSYVAQLVELGRERREGSDMAFPYIDHAFWSEAQAKPDVAGILVIDEV